MKTATIKKANRGHLRRATEQGRLFVKCRFHMTDDYAFDNAVNCGKMNDFVPAWIFTFERPEGYSDLDYLEQHQVYTKYLEIECSKHPGAVRMSLSDFRTTSGGVWGTTESGEFSVHSNLCYYYEIR